MILLQVNLVFSDKHETVYKGFYEIKNTSIFAWYLILELDIIVGLRGSIRRLPLNSKHY